MLHLPELLVQLWLTLHELGRSSRLCLTLNGEPATRVTALVLKTAPASPEALSARLERTQPTEPPSFAVALEWTDASGAEDRYRVERTPADTVDWQSLPETLPPDTQSVLDSDVTCGEEWSYRAIAVNEVGDSEPSETATVRVDCWFFADGFESGDTTAWSATNP